MLLTVLYAGRVVPCASPENLQYHAHVCAWVSQETTCSITPTCAPGSLKRELAVSRPRVRLGLSREILQYHAHVCAWVSQEAPLRQGPELKPSCKHRSVLKCLALQGDAIRERCTSILPLLIAVSTGNDKCCVLPTLLVPLNDDVIPSS
jgi:hypothetical protein